MLNLKHSDCQLRAIVLSWNGILKFFSPDWRTEQTLKLSVSHYAAGKIQVLFLT